MDGFEFGWREGVFLAVTLATAYLVVALARLARLGRARKPVVAAEPPAPPRPVAAPALSPGPTVPAAPFADELLRTTLEAEIRQLRADVASLREELEELKAARRVSPLYADAMDLGRRGFDARGIADECGISVAEAELVLAMGRDPRNLADEVNDGGDGRSAASALPGR